MEGGDARQAGRLTCNVGGLRGVEGQAHDGTGHLHHRRRLPGVQAAPVQVPGTHEGLQGAPVPVVQPVCRRPELAPLLGWGFRPHAAPTSPPAARKHTDLCPPHTQTLCSVSKCHRPPHSTPRARLSPENGSQDPSLGPHDSGARSLTRQKTAHGGGAAPCPGLAGGHSESWAPSPSPPPPPAAQGAPGQPCVDGRQMLQREPKGPPLPLTGHRHRPPRSPCCSRRRWSRADPALGRAGSPGCAGTSPARDGASPALSPRDTQQAASVPPDKNHPRARAAQRPESGRSPPSTAWGTVSPSVPQHDASRTGRKGSEPDPVLTSILHTLAEALASGAGRRDSAQRRECARGPGPHTGSG